MADAPAVPAPTTPPAVVPPVGGPTPASTTPPTPPDPADLGEAGKKALSEERKARQAAEKQAKEFGDRLQAIEDRDKTELQKATERADAAEKAAASTEREAMRHRVALSKGLPAELVGRLQGDDEAAMAADADQLLTYLSPGRPKGPVDQGFRGPNPTTATPREQFAALLNGTNT